MKKYNDIINLEKPKLHRTPMERKERAKIFMPFAALKGYEEALKEKQCIVEGRIELSEEERELLDYKVQKFQKQLEQGGYPYVKIKVFMINTKRSVEEKKELGEYRVVEGYLRKINVLTNEIIIQQQGFSIEDIFDIIQVN